MSTYCKKRKGPRSNTGRDSGQNLKDTVACRKDSSSDKYGNQALLRLACAALTVEELGEWLETAVGGLCLEQLIFTFQQTGQSRTSYKVPSEKDTESYFGKEAA
jgi:hypothetical protein